MSNVSGTRVEQFEQLDGVIAEWKDQPGGLLPIMQHAQELLGCVDEEIQKYISKETGIPVADIYGVSTFYSQFALEPKGKYLIGMCLGTACYVQDAGKIMDALSKELGIESGKTTSDGLFTLEATRCIGCCGLAPAMMVNDQVYGRLTPQDVPGIIAEFRKKG